VVTAEKLQAQYLRQQEIPFLENHTSMPSVYLFVEFCCQCLHCLKKAHPLVGSLFIEVLIVFPIAFSRGCRGGEIKGSLCIEVDTFLYVNSIERNRSMVSCIVVGIASRVTPGSRDQAHVYILSFSLSLHTTTHDEPSFFLLF